MRFLGEGASVSARDPRGRTALRVATDANHLAVARALVHARRRAQREVERLLVAAGAR
ncbi:MAG: hypothetical protein ACK5PW_16135 [Burkholderiales bacterium]